MPDVTREWGAGARALAVCLGARAPWCGPSSGAPLPGGPSTAQSHGSPRLNYQQRPLLPSNVLAWRVSPVLTGPMMSLMRIKS